MSAPIVPKSDPKQAAYLLTAYCILFWGLEGKSGTNAEKRDSVSLPKEKCEMGAVYKQR
jgi:hypothetical protein